MKCEIKWVEGAMFVGESGSGHALVLDGPPDGGGRNLGVRPMEMLLLGMGGCTAYDVVSILRKSRQDLNSCRVTLEAERAAEPPKVFTRIHVRYHFTGRGLDPGAVERAIALSTEKYCSATIMLGKVVDVSHDYEITEPSP